MYRLVSKETAILEHNAHVDGSGIEEDEEPPVPIVPIIEEDEEPPVPIVPIISECEADQKISGSNCMCDDGICEEGSTCVEGKTCTPECGADQKISGRNCMCNDGICDGGSTCFEGKTCTPECEADQKISGSNFMCDDGICEEGSTCVEGKTSTLECEADQEISGSNCMCNDEICEEGSTCVEGKTCTPGKNNWLTRVGRHVPPSHAFMLVESYCLTSPKYPNYYPNNVNIRLSFSVPAGQTIDVTFLDFDVEPGRSGCPFDYLEFSDGNGNIVGKRLCGYKLPAKITIQTSTASVFFHSDSSVRRKGFKFCWTPVTCSGGAKTLSISPGKDMVLCQMWYPTQLCEKHFETLCPAGWNLCTPGQFNNRNDGWNYNWRDAIGGVAGFPLGVIYCHGDDSRAGHYRIWDTVLNKDQGLNCRQSSSRPGCLFYANDPYYPYDCDATGDSALCCAKTSTCGNGFVDLEEDCDNGNDNGNDNDNECLNSCTWKFPEKHGLSGCPSS